LRPARGFTLVELLVVLAILVVVLALVPPLVAAAFPGVELKGAARQVAAGLRTARERALAARADASFEIDVDEHWFRVVGGEERRTELPARLALHLLTADQELSSQTRGAIRFFPDGSSTGGRVTLSYEDRGYDVGVDWLTGRIRIQATRPQG
jgi:general secretion pathway protein H